MIVCVGGDPRGRKESGGSFVRRPACAFFSKSFCSSGVEGAALLCPSSIRLAVRCWTHCGKSSIGATEVSTIGLQVVMPRFFEQSATART